MREGRAFWTNPFFHHEMERRERRFALAALLLANALFVAAFEMSRLRSGGAGTHAAPGATWSSAFQYTPWLWVGALLLSLSAHWLVPLSVQSFLLRKYELRPLEMLVRGRRTGKEALLGQVGGTLFPLALGAGPLLILLPLLARSGDEYLAPVGAAFGLALLWGALASGVSVWSGVVCRNPSRALLGSYVLICLVLPALVAAAATGVAYGCAAGRTDERSVFLVAAALTGSILVAGLAATFWDATMGRLFPNPQRCLWKEAPRDYPGDRPFDYPLER